MAVSHLRTRIRRPRLSTTDVRMVPVEDLTPDAENPREPHEARMALLRLSLAKLGFLSPVYVQAGTNLLLSGHQRLATAKELGYRKIPVMEVEVADKDIKGVNLVFNRTTNDFTAFDTGSRMEDKLDLRAVAQAAEALPDADYDRPLALGCKLEDVAELLKGKAEKYDKKAILAAHVLLRRAIRMPAIVTESGEIVNGIYRLFSAAEAGVQQWPTIRIPDEFAEVAHQFLNYLSMDYKIDGDFKELLRAGSFRRPSNDKSAMPKTYRFWANGCRTLVDRDSYSEEAWRNFREIHGHTVLDFGAGLDKVAPLLRSRGYDAYSFEPYLIDPETGRGEPDPDYSRARAREFLQSISNPALRFDSIFMSAVMNSIPFPEDRLKVLAIVNALCSPGTAVYGTCRDISDANYEYGGERRTAYFVMDGEPGVRIGDVTSRPKMQKFHSQAEADAMFKRFWRTVEFWGGGNIFYFKLTHPLRSNLNVLKQCIDFEFDLPFLDGTTLGLAKEANAAFMTRMGLD